jgi:peptidoglycan/xylan/chitin deacetylase (PgdA/CDA1 family)
LRGASNRCHAPLVPEPTRVSLTFDDGSSDQYLVRSPLAKHAIKATFYVNSGTVGTPGVLSWGQLSDLAADGHEIGGHTRDHVHLTNLSASEASRQIESDRQMLLSRGFDVSDFAYPYGEHNVSIERIVRRCGYKSARRAWGLCPLAQPLAGTLCSSVTETRPAGNRWATRTVESIRTWHTLTDLQRAITRAEEAGGGWVTLVFHHVSDLADRDGYAVSPEIFGGLLDWLAPRAALGTCVQTVRDVLAEEVPARASMPSLSRSKLAELVLPRLSGGVRPSW